MYARTRQLLRTAIAGALYYSGLLWLYAAFKLHRRVVVLMYHRVLPKGADSFSEVGIVVTPETFSRQLGFLRRYFRPFSVEQLADALHTGAHLPSRGCVVTFDDGWQDNVTHALPLLRQHQVPAVVFLATDYIGGDSCFWQERLARRMSLACGREGSARALVEAHTMPGIDQLPSAQRRQLIRDAIHDMKSWPVGDVTRYETELERASSECGIHSTSSGEDRFMSWRDVASLAAPSPLTAGAHGCSHVPLTSLAEAAAGYELVESRRRLETVVGQPISAFAYPNGNYDDTVAELTRRAGYRIAFTTQRGLVSEGDDALKLRRLNVHEASARTMPEFLCLILGVFHKWPRRV